MTAAGERDVPDGLTAGWVAQRVRGELVGPAGLPLSGLETLERAGPEHLTFIRSHAYALRWPSARAGAALVSRTLEVAGHDPRSRALIVVDDADLALIALLEALQRPDPEIPSGVHPAATIDPTAELAPGVGVGPGCRVGPGTRLDRGVILMANCVIGAQVTIGAGTVIHPGVVIYSRSVIGAACVLHAGVVIGADGFGYRPAPEGRGLVKIPHIGNVEIGSGVEIGANTCIDRAKFGSTVIGDGTKIDNLCQVGHNCRVGRSVVMCGMAGLAGSVTIGDGALLGAGIGVADNIRVGAGTRLGARTGVIEDIGPGETWFGYPARPQSAAMRELASVRQLPAFMRAVRRALKLPAQDTPRPGP
ncbi:MAG TPA: UDP-3-O-(3-hydroxymyristoyl)glucosamine N-acyltransferase [Phycisphaerales bacterium]|nr:UDP-3-O-(3-hydroxymyristoyl)glucosamine N-acyltransferase [Phycisphaerales bacterium]